MRSKQQCDRIECNPCFALNGSEEEGTSCQLSQFIWWSACVVAAMFCVGTYDYFSTN